MNKILQADFRAIAQGEAFKAAVDEVLAEIPRPSHEQIFDRVHSDDMVKHQALFGAGAMWFAERLIAKARLPKKLAQPKVKHLRIEHE
jgi:hypothetical protein